MSATLSRDSELRHLPLSQRRELAEILEIRDSWQILMASITQESSTGGAQTLKYSTRHISMVEREAKANASKLTASEILFDEWGTSGRKRPTLQTLMDLLAELKLYRAADYISMNILGGAPVERHNLNKTMSLEIEFTEKNGNESICSENTPSALEIVPYDILEDCCGWNYKEQGKEECIGIGAFACVFKAVVPQIDPVKAVAVKRFHQGNLKSGQQFEAELASMRNLNHLSMVRLLGTSEGIYRCLILELMVEGNLEDNLACKKRATPINWKDRIQIALGTAEGIQYLHSMCLVHRDIKSANILLDTNLMPKVADFGLMQPEKNEDDEDDETESQLEIAGTSCYMSPEAITYGKITMKGDVFSFGVVLLELLTSLPPDDENRIYRSLLLHVEDKCGENSISPLLDTKAGFWGGQGQPMAHKLYNLAVHSVNRRDDMRPTMKDVTEKISRLEFYV